MAPYEEGRVCKEGSDHEQLLLEKILRVRQIIEITLDEEKKTLIYL